jgi:hypothetical protein
LIDSSGFGNPRGLSQKQKSQMSSKVNFPSQRRRTRAALDSFLEKAADLLCDGAVFNPLRPGNPLLSSLSFAKHNAI